MHPHQGFTNKKMKKLLLLSIVIMTIFNGISQTITIPFKLTKQVVNGKISSKPCEYLFLTIDQRVCYDSDRKGFTVGNGVLRQISKGEKYTIYEGESFHGQSIYRLRNDFNKLNVEDINKGIIYVYERFDIPENISTSTCIRSTTPSHNSIGTASFIQSPQYDTFPLTTSEPRQRSRCSACGGTGSVKIFVGSSNYSVDVTYKCNICNEIMHTYDKHIHQTCSSCNGTGVL